MKIIPPGITFEQAILAGYTGRIDCDGYRKWLKTCNCWRCGYPPGDPMRPIDPSHYNGYKGMGTKSPIFMSLPECRPCHDHYELHPPNEEGQMLRLRTALMYVIRAFWEGRLVWKEA